MAYGTDFSKRFASKDFGPHFEARGDRLVGGAISRTMREDDGGDSIHLANEGDGGISWCAYSATERGGEIHASVAATITPGRRGKGTEEFALSQGQAPGGQRVGVGCVGVRSTRCERQAGGGERQGGSYGQMRWEVSHSPRLSVKPPFEEAPGALVEHSS